MSEVLFAAQPPPPPLSDLALVQNPALGAFALWSFGQGHQSEDERPVHFALLFAVLPLVLHRATLDQISSTNKSSGLPLFVAKLGKESEHLLAVHERALLLRPLTLQSIAVGVGARLLSIDYENCTVRSNAPDSPVKKIEIPERLKRIGPGAEKLGLWFSKFGAAQVASLLRMEF